jgi:diguanylate cyclase (GGDEF)-like protein
LLLACDQPGSDNTVLLLDVDNFKRINDALGHGKGDAVLSQVAARLERAVPPTADVARIGGDEFAILLPDHTPDVAARLATTLCKDIATPFPGIDCRVTVSIGVCRVTTVDRTLQQADLAMYSAKHAGRNRVVVYSREVEERLRSRDHASQPVAALQAERDRLHTEARTDALTGVANRRALDECISGYRGPLPVSLLFVDLDRFHSYNHLHGDLAGDRALKTVAQTLRQTSRDVDLVFRKGGEEFVVVLPGAGPAAAYAADERLRAAVEALGLVHAGAPDAPVVTVTVGTATREDGDLGAALNVAADIAYACKVHGHRNQVSPVVP